MKSHRVSILRAVRLGCLILALCLPAVPAEAAPIIVNTTDDTDDGVCNASHCSLQGDLGDVPVRPVPPTETPTPRVGCWIPGMAGNVCTVPCPSGATGGPCTLP